MSETRTDLGDDLSLGGDAELIARVRAGDGSAYGTLFARHVDAAQRLAVALAGRSEADDLVSEAFTRVLLVLRRGSGPDVAFRAYLLTSLRRLHVDRLRAQNRLQTTDDLTPYDEGVPFDDPTVHGFEGDAAARAFHSLPERWQLVLWHLEVEGQKPAEVAPLLGVNANAVSALAYRAREGLREAYLNMHTPDDLPDEECRWLHEHLGGYVRDGLTAGDSERVRKHLDVCVVCGKSYLELSSVNSEMRELIGPIVLGSALAAYLGAGKTAGGNGLGALLGRGRDLVSAHASVAAVTGVGVTVAAAVVTTAFVTGGNHASERPAADNETNVATTVAPGTPTTRPTGARSSTAASKAASASASAAPSAQPAPSASATATTRAAKASAKPSPSRTASPLPTVNVAVTVTRRGSTGGRWTVTGVPPGRTTRLTVAAPTGVMLTTTDARCSPVGTTKLSCRVGNGAGAFNATNGTGNLATVTVTVGAPSGYDDPHPNNNSASLSIA